MEYLHDGFLALAALSLGGALHHALAWARRRDLLANLLFAGACATIAVYAASMRMKLDTPDLQTWTRRDRLELSLIVLLLPLFTETIAAATRAGEWRRRLTAYLPLPALMAWHWISPAGFATAEIRGMEVQRTPWGETFHWVDGTTSTVYLLFLLYCLGWMLWSLRRAWIWARTGSPFSGWILCGGLVFQIACLAVETAAQVARGSFEYPLVEAGFLGLLGAMSVLLSDEVLRIANLQSQLEASRAELAVANGELERRVEERTRELKGALAELEMFSYSVSHDLRTPLRAIDGFAQQVLEEHGNAIGADGRSGLERVRKGAQKLGELFDDLVGLIRSRGSTLQATDFDLSALLREVAGEMCERHPDHDVHVEIQSSLLACTDRALLRTVLQQVLSNAWKFTRGVPGPLVEVFRDGAWLVVRDNGVGFDGAWADKLFRPFQKLHGPEEYPGNGVGLAIVVRILKRLGGDVRASGNPGAGAEFRLRVPGLSRARS